MEKLITALLLVATTFFTLPGHADSGEPNESSLTSHHHYINKYGQDVHSPSKSISGMDPAGASAQCRDGTYSFSKHHRGTCSRHGGVAEWMR
ncbi:MAG: DUF3761 domain-containing protein [Sulfuriferula sp.]